MLAELLDQPGNGPGFAPGRLKFSSPHCFQGTLLDLLLFLVLLEGIKPLAQQLFRGVALFACLC